MQFEQKDGIRENMLLARAFGATVTDVVQAIDVTGVYGTEKLGIAYEAAGDILDEWADAAAA